MNELPTSYPSNGKPEHAGASGGPVPASYPAQERNSVFSKVLLGGLALLAILLALSWWNTHRQIAGLREEMAKRLRAGESISAETTALAKNLSESMRELQGKVHVLESKQTEAQNQQLALEQLYQDLSKNRDEWALAEVEQVLSTASAQLQLAGNVQGALIALQNADKSLSRSDKPQFINVRRAIAKDIDRLKALPSVDLTGIALHLDSIIGRIDGLPLLSDAMPTQPAIEPKTGYAAKPADKNGKRGSEWLATLENRWQSWSSEMWSEVRQLVRVRNIETPDALLLSPTQAYYARENLKLRLLNARLALLSRNESAFRSDMLAAQDAISKYFDTRARQTQTVQVLLKQVQGSNLSIEMPTLSESLNAVRNYKAKP